MSSITKCSLTNGWIVYDTRKGGSLWKHVNVFLSLRSELTRKSYRSIITEWCNFLGAEYETRRGEKRMLKAKKKDVVNYLAWLKGKPGLKPRMPGKPRAITEKTVHRKYIVMKTLYTFLQEQEVTKENPFLISIGKLVNPRKAHKRPTELVPLTAVQTILHIPSAETKDGIRDRAILAVLFGTGMRRQEAVNLCLGNFCKTEQGTYYLKVLRAKGGVELDKALPEWTTQAVLRLVKQRREEGASPHDPLFVTYRGIEREPIRRLSDSTLYRKFKCYCAEAGLDHTKYSPHSARATAITKLLSDGCDYREVQEFSGHASIKTVEAYDKRYFSIDRSPGKKLEY